MDLQAEINESNRKIYYLERKAFTLERKLKKHRHLKSAGWIIAAISTGFASKLIEIPYKLSRMSGKLQKQAILKVLHFRIADIYYCHAERYQNTNGLYESELLITRETWITQRRQLLDSIRELSLKGDPLFNDPSEADSVLNSDYVVIPFDIMSARIKNEIPEQLRDFGIENIIMEFFRSS